MGVFSNLFGGSNQSSSSKPKDYQSDEAKAIRPSLSSVLQGVLGNGDLSNSNLPAYSGPYVAPMTSQQTDLMNKTVDASTTDPNYLTSAGDMLTKTLNGEFLGKNPYLDQYVDAAQRGATRNFTDVIVPQLLSRFTGGGQFVQGQGSSAFADQARQAGTDLTANLGDIAAKIYEPAYESERGNMIAAANSAQGLSSEQMKRLQTGLQAASLPQLINDLGVQRGLQEFDTRMTALMQALQVAGSVSQPVIANKTKGEGSSSTGAIPALFG